MRISVALTVHNSAKYLPDLLNSLCSQARLPDEVVAGDDCSSDGSLAFLDAFRRKAPFAVRVVAHEANLGVARNSESIYQLCTGDYIAICDADDVWYPTKLQRVEQVLEAAPETHIVLCDADLVDDNGSPMGTSLWAWNGYAQRQGSFCADPFSELLRGPCVTGPSMVFCAALLPSLLPIPMDWVQDHWVASVIAAMAGHGTSQQHAIVQIGERLFAYRRHSGQWSDTMGALAGETPLTERSKRLLDAASRYVELATHLERLSSANAVDPHRAQQVMQKAQHIQARAQRYLDDGGSMFALLKAFLSGRYSRFSTDGLRLFVKDVLRVDLPSRRHY